MWHSPSFSVPSVIYNEMLHIFLLMIGEWYMDWNGRWVKLLEKLHVICKYRRSQTAPFSLQQCPAAIIVYEPQKSTVDPWRTVKPHHQERMIIVVVVVCDFDLFYPHKWVVRMRTGQIDELVSIRFIFIFFFFWVREGSIYFLFMHHTSQIIAAGFKLSIEKIYSKGKLKATMTIGIKNSQEQMVGSWKNQDHFFKHPLFLFCLEKSFFLQLSTHLEGIKVCQLSFLVFISTVIITL